MKKIKMLKKLVSLLLVVLLLFPLAACGKSDSDADKGADTNADTNTSADADKNDTEEPTGSESSDEEVTLSLMVTTRPTTDDKDFYLDWLPELVKKEYPHINIQVEQLPTDQYKSTVKMKFASGQGPDIFTWWAGEQAKSLVEAGYVKNMSDFSQLGKFRQDIVNSYAFDGDPYAIPLGLSFLTTWYNKDAFAAAGISSIPANWDEFVDACEKLKAAGYTPITMGDKQSFVIQFGVYQIGASNIYADNMDFDKQLYTGETKFTDPQWVDTIEKYKFLYNQGYIIENSLGLSQEQSRQAFLDGKAAMVFDGSFGYDALNKNGAVEFEKGMFCIPSNDKDGEFVYNLTPSNGVFVSANSNKQDAINKVLELWFTEGTELFNKWVEKNDNISCYEGIEDSRELINEYLTRYKDYKNIYNLNNAWPEGVSDAMCSKFQEVIAGSASAEDVVKAMQDKFDQLTEN